MPSFTPEQKIHYTLRVAIAMCFIGHGAFGIITKEIWTHYFAVFGIGHTLAYKLMPPVGVVDILLGITMWLQQKLNPAPTDEIQKQVFAIMPWMFMVIMAPFAAGLQLYWVVSNTLTILQQKWLYSKHPAMKEAAAK